MNIGFLCTLEQRKTRSSFKIHKCTWITYEHMQLAQGKISLTITPSKEKRKIRIRIYLYVIKRKSESGKSVDSF